MRVSEADRSGGGGIGLDGRGGGEGPGGFIARRPDESRHEQSVGKPRRDHRSEPRQSLGRLVFEWLPLLGVG